MSMEHKTVAVYELQPGDQCRIDDTWCIVVEQPILDDERCFVPTQHGAIRFHRDDTLPALVANRPARMAVDGPSVSPSPGRISRHDERILWAAALVGVITAAWVIVVALAR